MNNPFSRLGEEILDLIYPNDLYCVCCGKIIDWSRAYHLCNECMDGIKWATGRTCIRCGKVLSDANPMSVCFNCREHDHDFDRGYTCSEYGTHERAMVFALKYDNRTDIAPVIAEIMSDAIQNYEYDLIVPVPVSRKKRNIRGYNQTALIAEEFSKLTGIGYEGEILDRIRETTAMKGLGPDERRRNIRGSFEVKCMKREMVDGARCLVLDDIYTTGATVDEIATVLKHCGARQVDFLSFASGADVVKS